MFLLLLYILFSLMAEACSRIFEGLLALARSNGNVRCMSSSSSGSGRECWLSFTDYVTTARFSVFFYLFIALILIPVSSKAI